MELWRPDWASIMRGVCGTGDEMDASELISITRGTARLAMSALRDRNATDYYHNSGAAERELRDALREAGADE